MDPLVYKRLVRVLPVSIVLIVMMGVLQDNGYWLNTTEAVKRFGLPVFLGSFWFNSLDLLFVTFAVMMASNQNNDYELGAFLTVTMVAVAFLSIPLGLAIGLTIGVGIMLMAGLSVILGTLTTSITTPESVKNFGKKLKELIWPSK